MEVAEDRDLFGAALAGGDFNGDDFFDIAIGVPRETNLAQPAVGAVHVLYGSTDKLVAQDNQLWLPSDFVNEIVGGEFGAALIAGDFNGDAIEDLAIGVPNAEINGHSQAGAVSVLYGTRDGLRIENSQVWHQDVNGLKGDAESNDHFGAALAAGDFNGDGVDDLVVGVPDDEINGHNEAGGVAVIYGSRVDGLRTEGDQFWHQDIEDPRDNVAGDAETGDHFGASLTVGDFNGDNVDDLAIGVPGDEINNAPQAGGVAVVYGQQNQGLVPNDNQFLHQDASDILGTAEADDNFGTAVVSGYFDNDPFADLAIGVPGQRIAGAGNAGAVQILYGTPQGIGTARDEIWHQDLAGIAEMAETNDRFGETLTAGDLQGVNDLDDLIIGVPGEDLDGLLDVGLVHLLESANDGVRDTDSRAFRPSSFGRMEHSGERFGSSLATGNFNDDPFLDLAMGAPLDRPNSVRGGSMLAVYGTSDFTQPTVTVTPTLSQEDPTNDADIHFNVVFSEAVQGFAPEDVTLGGTAGATTVEVDGSGNSYGLTVRGMVASGTVIVNIPAGVVVDQANNPNLASNNGNNLVTYEHPVTVQINQAVDQEDPASGDEIRFAITFSQAVTGFTAEDVTLSGTALPTTSTVTGGGTTYALIVSGMTRDGTVIASLPEGVVEPFNRASISIDNTVQYELPRAPSVVINQATNQEDPTSEATINFVAFFSEPVSGFTNEDVMLSGSAGATTVDVAGDGVRFGIVVSGMTRDGTVVAAIPAGVAIDEDGSSNFASTSADNVVEYQQQPVTVSVDQATNQADPTTDSTIFFHVRFSEPVVGLEPDDVDVGGSAGASSVNVTGSGANYQLAVTGMERSGTVTAAIRSNAVVPTNQASTSLDNSVSYVAPTGPVGWNNAATPFDVNNDGFVTPRDVLAIIIEINNRNVSNSIGQLPIIDTVPPTPPGFIDVNGDGFATPRDALLVINHINSQVALAIVLANAGDDEDDNE